MRNNIIIKTIIIGIAVAAVYLLSFPAEVTMESVLGFGIVFAMLRGAALEYSHTPKQNLGGN